MGESEEKMEEEKTYTFGWLPDYPDFRDYTEEHEKIKPLLEKTSVGSSKEVASHSPSVDLRKWCSDLLSSTLTDRLKVMVGSCHSLVGEGKLLAVTPL